jgi:hypothetical protein
LYTFIYPIKNEEKKNAQKNKGKICGRRVAKNQSGVTMRAEKNTQKRLIPRREMKKIRIFLGSLCALFKPLFLKQIIQRVHNRI